MKRDHAAREGRIGEAPSNVSGTRRITHEIDTKYGARRSSGSSIHPRTVPERLEPRPAQVPTWRAPMALVEAPRRSRSRPKFQKVLDLKSSIEEPRAQACWLSTHLEALLELDALPDGSVAVDQKTLSADEQLELAIEALGALEQVPQLRVRSKAVLALDLDPREAFVLSLVDGRATLDEIVDMSGMPELDALLLLLELRSREIIDCGD